MFKGLIDWYLEALDSGGYPLIVLLMAIESSLAPLPSELVIPPAAVLSASQGRFSLEGVMLAGAIGSWIGASVMYWISRFAGRPLILRYGRYIFISEEKVHGAERWAAKFGPFGVFASRFLPVVRHLIGIPAGILQINFWWYSFYTFIGSGLWCGVLYWVGIKAGQDKELMAGNLHRITIWCVGMLIVLGALYFGLVHRHMKPRGPR